jgi:hypothetical protein
VETPALRATSGIVGEPPLPVPRDKIFSTSSRPTVD